MSRTIFGGMFAQPATTPAPSGIDRRVNLLAAAWCVNVLAFSIVYPFLPIYLHKIRGFPMSKVGLMFPIMGAARITAPLVAGWFVDRFGRRGMLWVSPLVRSAIFLALAWMAAVGASFRAFAVGLFLSGFVGQFFQGASDAYVSDITPTELRPDAYSRIRVGLNLGWMIGPAIGAFLAQTPFSLIFTFTGVLCIGGAAIAFFYCSESLAPVRPAEQRVALKHLSLPGRRELVWHLGCAFMLFLVTSQLASTLSVYAVGLPGIDKNGVGFLYTVNGLVVILIQIPLNRALGGGRLSTRLACGAILYSLGYFSMGYGTVWVHLMLSVVILTLGETLAEPALAAGVSRLSAPERMGRAMGIYGLVRGVGYSLGPYVGALLYERLVSRPVLLWGLLAASAIPAALGFVMMRRVKEFQ